MRRNKEEEEEEEEEETFVRVWGMMIPYYPGGR